MATDHRTALKSIRTFPVLVEYLRDEMGWPIESEDFEELTFEYTPGELGLKDEDAVKIRTIHQLRQLQPGQPWGIFFVEFERKRLPVVVLRRILSRLVVKKRASANKAQRPAWHLHDLLFISAFAPESSDQREIAFAHFHQEDGDLPTLRVLGWDGADTGLKLDYVADVLHQRLGWPDNAENIAAWRSQWSSAFRHRIGHIIRTADSLAERLADLARGIRDAARTMLAHESERGSLTRLYKAFQTALIHDLSEADFADTYAQTITYGLLTAAISRTEMMEGRDGTALLADNVTDMVPITNPFLREMLQTFLKAGGRDGGIDFDELGIQEVVELLRGNETDLPAVLRDFGNRSPGEDPVIHFYEHFLAAYDRKLKVKRGVFYTPLPVVSYIVRSVHELLQTEFGIEDGLASTITWGEMAERHKDFRIPDGTPPDAPFVMILDPAAGTGTFLVEVIDVVHRTLTSKWKREGLGDGQQHTAWNQYVPRHLLPRLHGYELMMAPYAIAHMKLPLKLKETGFTAWNTLYTTDRIRIYLTNSLDPPEVDQKALEGLVPELAHEAVAVNYIKQNLHFTALIGNPPYSLLSANLEAHHRALIESYKFVSGERIRERSALQLEKNLNDDYVKFMRLAQLTINKAGGGISGLITNHSFLDNPTMRGMRWNLLDYACQIRIIDLHGNSTKKERAPDGGEDTNVFQIKQGVAIGLSVRLPSDSEACQVSYHELWGNRQSKEAWLALNHVGSHEWELLQPVHDLYLFVPQDSTLKSEFEAWPSLQAAMPVNGAGYITARDNLVVDFERDVVIRRVREFQESQLSDDVLLKAFNVSRKKGWDVHRAREELKHVDIPKRVIKTNYRPFDIRWIFFDSTLVWGRSWPTMQHIVGFSPNLAMLATRMTKDQWDVWSARTVSSHKAMSAYDTNSVFPLYLAQDSESSQQDLTSESRINFSSAFLDMLTGVLELEQETAGELPSGLTAEEIFCYAYAVFHSPGYRTRYEEFLKRDFPHLPLTGQLDVFRTLAKLGSELIDLHLLESPTLTTFMTTYIGSGNAAVERVGWSDEIVWLDAGSTKKGQPAKHGTRGFLGVPEVVWNFHIGGYQVCEKWLKDRKGRTLSDEEIGHYQKIVVALAETIRIMGEIDQVIEQHGGWPGAFVTEEVALPAVAAEGLVDLGSVAPEAWGTPQGLTQENLALFAIIDVLRQLGGSAETERVRLAAMLVRSPALARPFMDAATREKWARVVGKEAEPLPENVIPLRRHQQDEDEAWRAAVAQLQGSGAIVVDAASGTWSAGDNLPPSSGQAWIEGRAAVAVALLAEVEASKAEQTLATFAQDVEHGRTGTAVS